MCRLPFYILLKINFSQTNMNIKTKVVAYTMMPIFSLSLVSSAFALDMTTTSASTDNSVNTTAGVPSTTKKTDSFKRFHQKDLKKESTKKEDSDKKEVKNPVKKLKKHNKKNLNKKEEDAQKTNSEKTTSEKTID